MSPQIRTLKELGYVIECLANDYTGEAKSELSALVKLVEEDDRFAFPGHRDVARELGEAHASLIAGDIRSGASTLTRISRLLWQQVPDSDS